MRSCARGHNDTAILLCKWNSTALEVENNRKQTPAAVAIENGLVFTYPKLKSLKNFQYVAI